MLLHNIMKINTESRSWRK